MTPCILWAQFIPSPESCYTEGDQTVCSLDPFILIHMLIYNAEDTGAVLKAGDTGCDTVPTQAQLPSLGAS